MCSLNQMTIFVVVLTFGGFFCLFVCFYHSLQHTIVIRLLHNNSFLIFSGTMVTMNVEGLQSLTSDGATLAVQQVMLGGHSEDESGESGDEDDDADMAGLGLDNSDSLQ